MMKMVIFPLSSFRFQDRQWPLGWGWEQNEERNWNESTQREKEVKLVFLGISFPIKMYIFIVDILENVNKQKEESNYSLF